MQGDLIIVRAAMLRPHNARCVHHRLIEISPGSNSCFPLIVSPHDRVNFNRHQLVQPMYTTQEWLMLLATRHIYNEWVNSLYPDTALRIQQNDGMVEY